MNYVNEQNMQEILDGIARKIGTGGGSGAGLEDWKPSHEYIEKDICVYEGQIYRAKVGFTSDTTFSTIQIFEEYEPVGGETIIPYEQDTEISIDDIVSYDNNTYKALYNFVCGEEFSLYALEEYVPIELTDDDIKEIVGAYNPVFEEAKGINYSTTEQRIGTWINGKPLYQVTLVATNVSTSAKEEYKIGSITSDVDKIVDIQRTMLFNTDGVWSDRNLYSGASDSATLTGKNTFVDGLSVYQTSSVSFTTGDVVFYCNTAVSGYDIFITIQYTKTTD